MQVDRTCLQLGLVQQLRVDRTDLQHMQARLSLQQAALAQHLHDPSAGGVEARVQRRRLLVSHHTTQLLELCSGSGPLLCRLRLLDLRRELMVS